ncbi:hypothetical protein B0H67DRAFT_552379 [Lasiosphaeris hirsuta]|uniref:BZIP domain-containing protein n=1 Tax=Lasiosphaeris hirsuta TaxID=260670 RepID=A0AA40AQH7_9PEZI|nr:hypothetical protein B0H67DRAFT_552379 [Lasiosphaeris hirsuta]
MPSSEEIDDAELSQRRERGRLAQRAFRRRQIDTIRELREDNQALREAIDQISRAAARGPAQSHNDQASLQAAIQNAFRVAGLNSSVARAPTGANDGDYDGDFHTPGPSGQQQQQQQQQQQHQQGMVVEDMNSNIDFTTLGAPLLPTPPQMSTSLTTAQQNHHLIMDNLSLYGQTARPAAQMTSPPRFSASKGGVGGDARMSPRMTYGLWFEPDRAIRIVQPPRDIVPYVGDGMRSLAGAIFWAGMGFSLRALRTVIEARFRSADVSYSSFGDYGPDSDDDEADNEYGLSSSDSNADGDGRSTNIVILASDDDEDYYDNDNDQVDDEANNDDGTRQTRPRSRSRNQTPTQTQSQSRPATTTQTQNPPRRARPPTHPAPSSSSRTPTQTREQKESQYRKRIRQATRAVERMFGPTLRLGLVSDQAVFDIIHARFAWRRMGYIAGDHPGRDPEAPMRLFAAILRDLDHTADLGEARLWMTPTDVEAYVRERLRVTPAGWTPWQEALAGRGQDERRVNMVKKLVWMVAYAGTCFGDGPRWRIDALHALIEKWVEEVAQGPDGVGVWY